MTKDQIQANKPDGATHYFLIGDDVNYHKVIKGVDFYYRDGKWLISAFNQLPDIYRYLQPLSEVIEAQEQANEN